MGWWDYGIMGGDTPWDVAGDATDLLGLDDFEDMHLPHCWTVEEQQLVKEALIAYGGPKKLCGHIISKWKGNSSHIIDQVVGLLAISSGFPIDEEFRQYAIAACDDEIDALDQKVDPERITKLNELKELLINYQGQPISIDQTSLFEKMFG